MTGPVRPRENPPLEPEPIIVIDVESQEIFDLMGRMVNVIHAANIARNPQQPPAPWERDFKPMSAAQIRRHQRESQIEADELAETISQNTQREAQTTKTPTVSTANQVPGEEKKDPLAPKPSSQLSNIEVPDLTDRSRRNAKEVDFNLKFFMEKLLRIVKEIQLATVIKKGNDKARETAEGISKNAEVKNQESRRQLEAPGKSLESPEVERDEKELAQVENVDGLQADSESHQVDLILERIAEDGHVEQIPVERGEIAALLKNLEGLLEGEQAAAIEELLAQTAQVTENLPQGEGSLQGNPIAPADSAPEIAQMEGGGPQAAGQGGQVSAGQPAAPGAAAAPLAGNAAAAMASFMPFQAPAQGRQELVDAESAYRVEQIEETNAVTPFNPDAKEAHDAEAMPVEAALLAKAQKTPKEQEMREISEAAKDQRSKKAQNTQRLDDGKIIPVYGKFTLDQLGKIRRRRLKGEGGGGGSAGEKTHRLIDIFYMVLAAVVSGAQTIFDISAFIESREKLFTTLLGLKNGVPSSKLISKLLTSFNASQLTEMLNVWIREAQGAPYKSGLASMVLVDTFEGLIIAQEKSAAPSTAELCLPRVLQFFDLRRSVILMSNGKGSQQNFERLLASGAQFIYDCGDDPFPGEAEALPLFEQAMVNRKEVPQVHYTESYLEGQEYLQLFEVEGDFDKFIKSASQLVEEVHTPKGKEDSIRYYVSSIPKQSVWLFELLRTQRGIEDQADWMVNISMRSRHGDEAAFSAREFLAIIRRYAVMLLLRDQSFKAPLHAKQQRAAKENEYLLKLLKL